MRAVIVQRHEVTQSLAVNITDQRRTLSSIGMMTEASNFAL